jgi:Tfp pilus assembly pilus retraction ATPase PilT
VSSLPTLHGEKLVLRILDIQSQQLRFDHLGMPPKELSQLMQAIHKPNGMVLITGPTGSGKTVTLYTCLNHLNTTGVNIATVEDPSEIVLAGANQVNVNERIGLTFDVALRALLRQDPDIVMVGEIRDFAVERPCTLPTDAARELWVEVSAGGEARGLAAVLVVRREQLMTYNCTSYHCIERWGESSP